LNRASPFAIGREDLEADRRPLSEPSRRKDEISMRHDDEPTLTLLREINQNLLDLRNILVNSLDPMTVHGLAYVIREGFRGVAAKLDLIASPHAEELSRPDVEGSDKPRH
jgi:hypothetical protein